MSRNKIAIAISLSLMLTMAISLVALPTASAHDPPWEIPTYAYIVGEPNPVGVGQTAHVYMWLAPVYGAAGGRNTDVGWNASTTSTALPANSYRFKNYKLTITAPDGHITTQTFDTIWDTTSNQFTRFVPDQAGTYNLKFEYAGQVYGEDGNGYEKSPLIGDSYMPSSAETTITVQEEPLANPLGSNPLPSEYWTRPIYGEGTDWWSISSNWLGSGAPVLSGYTSSSLYQPDAIGPLTSHVMWTRPLQFGGVVGGDMFAEGSNYPEGDAKGVMYFEGSSYEPRFVSPIIVAGKLFYTDTVSFTGATGFGGTSATGPTNCVDLRTGEVLWSRADVPQLSFAYIYNLWNPDQHGTFPPILFTSNFGMAFDAYTGDAMFNVTNVPSGTSVAGPAGEQLRYVIRNAGTSAEPQFYLSQWNSSKLWQYDTNPYTGRGSFNPSVINASNGVIISNIPVPLTGTTGTIPTPTGGANFFVPYGSTITVDADIPINSTTLGGEILGSEAAVAGQGINTYDWNVSLPWANSESRAPTIVAANYGDSMLCRYGSLPAGFKGTANGVPQEPYTMLLVNLDPSRGAIGNVVWKKTYDPPEGNITMAFTAVDWETRVFVFNYEETLNWVGYSLEDGDYLWTTPTQESWDYYGVGNLMVGALAYGNLYTSGFSGVCYCFDDLTGDLLWTYGNGGKGNSTNAGLSVSYGVYPTFIQSIHNGVVYTATNEHTIPNPLYKGCTYRAMNATTGEELWQLSGYPSEWARPGSAWAAADGYLTCMNGLDNNIYSIGRGPSATTVSAPQVGLSFGQSLVISGTVFDISAGTNQDEQAARFPNGVACASDAIMKEWMGYVYQQKAFPTDFEGVEVTLSVIDSNNNYYDIGTATTDANGFFRYTYTPDIPGDFLVFATFNGTNGYWPSQAESAFTVMEAPATSPIPTPTAGSMTDTYVIGLGVGAIIAIIIIGLVLILMLRKR